MKRPILLFITCVALLLAPLSQAAPKKPGFSFGVIGLAASGDDAVLREALRQSEQRKAAFIVVNGIRSRKETCSNSVFQRRKHLLDEAGRAVIVSLAARDWAECKSERGDSVAQERLDYLRGLLFYGEHAVLKRSISLVRQSSAAKFRSYAENASWQFGQVLFATLNLPANNNHYLTAAGRNNEFEDRLVANRAWLQRISSQAKRHKMRGIVLFTDANPLVPHTHANRAGRRDGFVEVRKQIAALSAHFPGRVLLVHGQASSGGIAWHGKLGVIGAGRDVLDITVHPASASVFAISHRRR